MEDIVRILSIDGGGIRGIIPALILQYLEERIGKPVKEERISLTERRHVIDG